VSSQFEGGVFQFRPKVNRNAQPGSLDFEEIPVIVVPNASGLLNGRAGDCVPTVCVATDVVNPLRRSDLPFFLRDSNLCDHDHNSEDRAAV